MLGDSSATVPHIVLLDAGLADDFPQSIFTNVHDFFDAITSANGKQLGRAILGLSPTQPYVVSPEAFIEEVNQRCIEQTAECDAGEGNSAANIRAYMQSVRDHRVVLDPTVMVALMSMLVLEGWQARLDPSVCIMDSIKLATGGGVIGVFMEAGSMIESIIKDLKGDQAQEDASNQKS